MFYLLLFNKVSISQQKLETLSFPVLKLTDVIELSSCWIRNSQILISPSFFFFLLILFFFFNWVVVVYSVALLSAMHQHESATGIRVSPPLFSPPPTPPHPSGLSQRASRAPRGFRPVPRWLSALHMVAYMFQCRSLHSSHPLLTHHVPSCWPGWAGALKHAKPLARAQLWKLTGAFNKPGAASGAGPQRAPGSRGPSQRGSSAPLLRVAWVSTLPGTATECLPGWRRPESCRHTLFRNLWKGLDANQGLLFPEAAVSVSLQTKTFLKKRATWGSKQISGKVQRFP